MTAFAFGRLARVNVFHHSPSNSVTLEHPYRFYQPSPPREGPGRLTICHAVLCKIERPYLINPVWSWYVAPPAEPQPKPEPCDPGGTAESALDHRPPVLQPRRTPEGAADPRPVHWLLVV